MARPRLSRPVPRPQVRAELAEVYAQAGIPGRLYLSWPSHMDDRNARSPRSFAEVRPDTPARFAFAEEFRWLPAQNRQGLYAHEVGHVLDPGGSEDEADRAAEKALGIRIGYDRRWPGKGLQTTRRRPVRRLRNPFPLVPLGNPGCAGVLFDDGFCSPRGELDSEPAPRWAKGCAAETVLVMGDDHHGTAQEIAREGHCSTSSTRRYLDQMAAKGWIKKDAEVRGLDRTGRKLYSSDTAVLDAADWVRYRRGEYQSRLDAEASGADDPLGIGAYEGDAGIDPWDWRQEQDWTFQITVEAPQDPSFDPWRFFAWSQDLGDYPIAELVMFESGQAVYDARSFGDTGPMDYAPVGRMRVHPAFRQAGVATALLEAAAAEAGKLGVPLASGDARTPGQAAWWTAQVKAGRARKIRHRSRAHPEAARYLLDFPAPKSLELKGKGGKRTRRRAPQEHQDASADAPFNNPPYQEDWWGEIQQVRQNPCLPCLFLL